jgi:hypothetical protein
LTGRVPLEPGAAPYSNWNERITSECYAPLAEQGRFEQLSFNLGGTLARWLAQNERPTYERIIAGASSYLGKRGFSNGLIQPTHHTILPLARRRDKLCQVRWGIASFAHHFGHTPQGMWLPEMAVDLETLDIAASEGIRFTILSDEQVRGELASGAGPYKVRLPSGGDMAVYVRDQHLSNSLSFNMPAAEQAEEWIENQLRPLCAEDTLILIATDGETFGHHHRHGADTLGQIITAAADQDLELLTLEAYLHDHPPHEEVEIVERSSWSCGHGLARWATGCDCTQGDSRWKGALRRALDNLASEADCIFEKESQALSQEPWSLRDDYIGVVLGDSEGQRFLGEHGMGGINSQTAERILALLEAQFYRQRMYASCAFFFEDLDRPEPRYAIANGLHALTLVQQATGDDLKGSFERDLSIAISGESGVTGADLLVAIEERRA